MNVPETIKSGNPNMARRAFLFTGAAGIASSPFWLGKLFNPSFTPEQQKDIDDRNQRATFHSSSFIIMV